MHKLDFQRVALLCIREAKVLLDNLCYEGAYYLSGYAVECSLKACIAKRFREHDIPLPNDVKEIYVHDLTKLIRLAELARKLDDSANPQLIANWSVVKDWSEQTRYFSMIAPIVATDTYNAITDDRDGVLTWIKTFW